MPAPVPLPVRRHIYHLATASHLAPRTISQRLDVPLRTVQALLRRCRLRGEDALAPDYAAPEAVPSPRVAEALQLRLDHPTWGAGRIRVELACRHPQDDDLPSTRTLERWCRRCRHPPAPAGRRPQTRRPQARQPHDVWEMDAAEQKRLATRALVSWLRFVDDYSGAVLGTRVFSPRLLHPSARPGGAGRAAAALWPLGPTRLGAGRQWLSLGQLQ